MPIIGEDGGIGVKQSLHSSLWLWNYGHNHWLLGSQMNVALVEGSVYRYKCFERFELKPLETRMDLTIWKKGAEQV